MIPTTTVEPTQRSEWFASWFDSPRYHRLYAHRDETEAARFVDRLLTRISPRPGARVLDLGCGAGRHSAYLASKGLRATGLDLAAGSIREAKKRMFAPHHLCIEQVHGDYCLSPYDPLTSPRMILVARRTAPDVRAGYLRERRLRTRLTVSGDTPRYDASIH